MYKLLEKALEHVRETFCGYISLFEKFLSFYEEIIDAQRFFAFVEVIRCIYKQRNAWINRKVEDIF